MRLLAGLGLFETERSKRQVRCVKMTLLLRARVHRSAKYVRLNLQAGSDSRQHEQLTVRVRFSLA